MFMEEKPGNNGGDAASVTEAAAREDSYASVAGTAAATRVDSSAATDTATASFEGDGPGASSALQTPRTRRGGYKGKAKDPAPPYWTRCVTDQTGGVRRNTAVLASVC
jgi:hypothetical protein